MVDYTQILLFAVIIILTFLLLFIGIKIYFILDEVLKAMIKANRMLDYTEELTGDIGKSVKNLSGFGEGLKTAFKIVHMLSKDSNKND
jgi:hypothetical protein